MATPSVARHLNYSRVMARVQARCGPERGFTLVELLVALGVATLLISATLTALSDTLTRWRVRQASHDIASGDDWYPNRSFTLANVPATLPLSLGVVEADGDFTSIGWYAKSFGLETHGPGENETWTRTLHAANGEYSGRR